MTVTQPGVIVGMSDAEYHADPVPGGSLSSTGARRILDSPARFDWERTHRVESRAFDVGHAVHMKILGVGPQIVAYPDEHLTPSGNPSTRAATKAWEDGQRAEGFAPIAPSDLARVNAMVEAVLAHTGARSVLEQPGDSEVSAFAPDPETGVWCRARFDRLGPHIAADVKTTAGSASSAGFGRDAAKYGYPIQEAHYLDTLLWATGEQPPMTFVCVEKARPHLVAVHQFDEVTRLTARDLAAKARRIYAECMATGEWPGYPDEVMTTHIPAWWINQADDDMEIEF